MSFYIVNFGVPLSLKKLIYDFISFKQFWSRYKLVWCTYWSISLLPPPPPTPREGGGGGDCSIDLQKPVKWLFKSTWRANDHSRKKIEFFDLNEKSFLLQSGMFDRSLQKFILFHFLKVHFCGILHYEVIFGCMFAF